MTDNTNYSTVIFLISDKVRLMGVSYEPLGEKQAKEAAECKTPHGLCYQFKSMDQSIKVGDLVVVPTGTRHNFTICKVQQIDAEPDFQPGVEYKWIAAVFDRQGYDQILAQESEAVTRVRSAKKRRMREELKKDVLADAEAELKALPIYSQEDAPPKIS